MTIATTTKLAELCSMRTWIEEEPKIRKTQLGYLKKDLRSRWVIRVFFDYGEDDPSTDWWYLLWSGWGELYMDDMLVFTAEEAKSVATLFDGEQVEIRRLSDRIFG